MGLLEDLSQRVAAAFVAEGLAADLGQVRLADRPDLAQFQCNGALAAAKAQRVNPRELATRLARRLEHDPLLARIEVAGPGFINLDVRDGELQSRLRAQLRSAELGAPRTGGGRLAIMDFGGPNVAKPMHVGHLRSSIIGDCLQRLFRANGWRVISDVHLGDWGLQMGQLISEIQIRGLAPVYFDAHHEGPYPAASPVSMDDLEALYPAAAAACKSDPGRLEAARLATAELQAGRPGYRALWQHFVRVSEEGLTREFSSLGVHFDEWNGESDADPLIGDMIADLRRRGLAVSSDGALVMAVAEPDDKKEMPPLLLLKSDGAVLYGTTDLATILARVSRHDPDLILYIVDQRQHVHFEQVFRAARKAGLARRVHLEHAGFGTMNGPDGKPFKTRAGGVMKLYELIAMAKDEALKRLAEAGLAADYSDDERAEIARKVGIAAIKFADLSNHRTTDYVFDLNRFMRFEGKTGPYLQYAAVRIQSILRKAAAAELDEVSGHVLDSVEERALMLQLLLLAEAMANAEEKRAPNILCDYAFELAQRFSRVYAAHHILAEEDRNIRLARLELLRLTLAVLIKVLDLLGIEVPARM